jgi:hypothetical protein
MGMELRKPHVPHVTLNTDGQRHPRENATIAVAAFCGVVALAFAPFENMHVPGTWLGLLGVIAGFYAQYISATTAERMVNVVFLGMAAVGFAINMAHGGFI